FVECSSPSGSSRKGGRNNRCALTIAKKHSFHSTARLAAFLLLVSLSCARLPRTERHANTKIGGESALAQQVCGSRRQLEDTRRAPRPVQGGGVAGNQPFSVGKVDSAAHAGANSRS